MIYRPQITHNFTRLPIFEDSPLVDSLWILKPMPLKIFAYIHSKPQDWNFAAERAAKELTIGVRTFRRAAKTLQDLHLLTIKEDGRRAKYFVRSAEKFIAVPNFFLKDLNCNEYAIIAWLFSKPEAFRPSAKRISEEMTISLPVVKTTLNRLEGKNIILRQRAGDYVDIAVNPECAVEVPGKMKKKPMKAIMERKEVSTSDIFQNACATQGEEYPEDSQYPLFDFFLKEHNQFWRQKHTFLKNETIQVYHKILDLALDCETADEGYTYGQYRDDIKQFFQAKRGSDYHFPIFTLEMVGKYKGKKTLYNDSGELYSLPFLLQTLEAMRNERLQPVASKLI